MKTSETSIDFTCGGDRLYGVIHHPATAFNRGVLILGRINTHRQGVFFARSWAESGIPVLRFDLRGRGYSEGTQGTIDDTEADIRSAVDTFFRQMPSLQEVVIWGLSEMAAGAILYGPTDPRVTGLILANPWIKADRAVARANLRHHLSKIWDPGFWAKLRTHELGCIGLARAFVRNIVEAFGIRSAGKERGDADGKGDNSSWRLKRRVAQCLKRFTGRVLFVLSKDDPIAAVFREEIVPPELWRELLPTGRVARRELPDADHVFSRRAWLDQVATWAGEWVRSL